MDNRSFRRTTVRVDFDGTLIVNRVPLHRELARLGVELLTDALTAAAVGLFGLGLLCGFLAILGGGVMGLILIIVVCLRTLADDDFTRWLLALIALAIILLGGVS